MAAVNNGTVTAKSAGTATITATAGGKSASCAVNVQSAVINVTWVSLSNSSLSLTVGDSTTLTATVTPSNATNRTVSWSSSNSSVASVNNGTVTAKGPGNATITATAGGKSASCTVNVQPAVINVTGIILSQSSMSLNIGESATLTATVTPSNATNKTVTWSSSNTSVATVNNGTVTAKSDGTATITATAGGKSVNCPVTVTAPTFTLTYNYNDGTGKTSTKEIARGSSYGTLPTPTRDYYSLVGWFTSANGGTQVASSTVMGSSSVTIYAHWELKPFSGQWSEWSSTYVSDDQYTMVESRETYQYPIYRFTAYGTSFTEIKTIVYMTCKKNQCPDIVLTKIKGILMGSDPFNTGVTNSESDPVKFVTKNVNGLNSLDNNIQLISDTVIVFTPYSSGNYGDIITVNGQQWLLDTSTVTKSNQYRYQKRIK